MDFIDGLPNSRGKIAIMVVVNRLTKYAYFTAFHHPYTTQTVAKVFLDTIYRFYGFLNTITFDRDPIFVCNFWQELFKLQGVSL